MNGDDSMKRVLSQRVETQPQSSINAPKRTEGTNPITRRKRRKRMKRSLDTFDSESVSSTSPAKPAKEQPHKRKKLRNSTDLGNVIGSFYCADGDNFKSKRTNKSTKGVTLPKIDLKINFVNKGNGRKLVKARRFLKAALSTNDAEITSVISIESAAKISCKNILKNSPTSTHIDGRNSYENVPDKRPNVATFNNNNLLNNKTNKLKNYINIQEIPENISNISLVPVHSSERKSECLSSEIPSPTTKNRSYEVITPTCDVNILKKFDIDSTADMNNISLTTENIVDFDTTYVEAEQSNLDVTGIIKFLERDDEVKYSSSPYSKFIKEPGISRNSAEYKFFNANTKENIAPTPSSVTSTPNYFVKHEGSEIRKKVKIFNTDKHKTLLASEKLKSEKSSKVRKVPNFALIHKKMYNNLENINEYSQRKAERARILLSGCKLAPISQEKLKNLISDDNKIHSAKTSKKQLQFCHNIPSVYSSKQRSPSKLGSDNIFKTVKASHAAPKVSKEEITRFGFKVNAATNLTKDEQIRAVINKSKVRNENIQGRRQVIKGVRSNRRFDLLMSMRNQEKC